MMTCSVITTASWKCCFHRKNDTKEALPPTRSAGIAKWPEYLSKLCQFVFQQGAEKQSFSTSCQVRVGMLSGTVVAYR